jgi:MFS transporter, ACS family, glucarate transporter
MKRTTLLLALLAPLSIITYIDRICIAVAGPKLQAEFGITNTQLGYVLSAFLLAYGLFEIPSGALGDRFGQRKTLGRIVVWWSLFTAITGAATGLWSLVAIRFLFGMGEAGAYPNMSGAVRGWFKKEQRGRVQGFIWGFSRIGGAIAPLMVVPVMAWFGWRISFVIFGSMGLIWVACWYWLYRDPDKAQTAAAHGDEVSHGGHGRAIWGILFRSPQVWLLMAVYFCYVFGPIFFLNWMPNYLVKGRGFTTNEMAFFSSAPFVLGAIGCFVGGALCDFVGKRVGVSKGRRLVGTCSLLISAICILVAAMVSNRMVAVVVLAIGLGAMDFFLPAAWALATDLGKEHVGAVSGAMNTAGQLGGVLCINMFGIVVDRFGSYNLPLVIIAGMVFTAGLLFSRINPDRGLAKAKGTEPLSPAAPLLAQQ